MPHVFGVESSCQAAGTGGNIHDARRAMGFLEKWRKRLEHQEWPNGVSLETLRHLLCERAGRVTYASIVDERV